MKKLLLVLLIFLMAYAGAAGKMEKRNGRNDFQRAIYKQNLGNDFLRVFKNNRLNGHSKKSLEDTALLRERINARILKNSGPIFLSKINSTVYPLTVELEYLYDESAVNTFTYNEAGMVIEDLFETFISGEQDVSYKALYTYDNNGNILTEIYQYEEDGTWINEERYTYTYDNTGRIETEIYEEFYDGAWEKYWKDIYTWEDGKLVEISELVWDGSDWYEDYKSSATYDNDGNLLQVIFFVYEDESWLTQEMMSWTYDEYGNELTVLMESFDETGALQSGMRETMTYDSNNNVITTLIELFAGDAWISYFRILYTYADNGGVLTETEEIYNEDTGDWQSTWVTSYNYTYDARGNLTELVEAETYDGNVTYLKEIYTYDNNNNCYQAECYESWDDDTWEDSEASLWLPYNNGADEIIHYAHKIIVNYSDATSIDHGTKVPEKIMLSQNYPNPFNPATTISFTLPVKSNVKLTVFNGLGQKVDEIVNSKLTAGLYSYNFDATGLNSGIYFYKLQTDDNQIVKKMVLIK